MLVLIIYKSLTVTQVRYGNTAWELVINKIYHLESFMFRINHHLDTRRRVYCDRFNDVKIVKIILR